MSGTRVSGGDKPSVSRLYVTPDNPVRGRERLNFSSQSVTRFCTEPKNHQLHIFREPTSGGYSSHLILSEPNQIVPLVFPDVSLSLTSIFPPSIH